MIGEVVQALWSAAVGRRWSSLLERGGWWTDLNVVCIWPLRFEDGHIFGCEWTRDGGEPSMEPCSGGLGSGRCSREGWRDISRHRASFFCACRENRCERLARRAIKRRLNG